MKLFNIILLSLFFVLFADAKEKKPIDINIDNISAQAKIESKHTVLYFHMTYCPYCKKMAKFTFKNKDIKKQLDKNFLFVDINIDDDDNIRYKNFFDSKKQFAKHLAVNFYPTVIFIDEENTIVYILKGYRTKDKFNIVLGYIKSKSYLDMNLEEYIDELEFNK
ncbi:MAG: thioredoxin family protein [Campylobacterota bacterium]|nr:thioredoxin family protein [Campylobacterota bacterium]